MEAAYGERAGEVATELAVHFEQGREYRRAIGYLQRAGENALQRSAHQEAITHFTKGLELLKTLPNTSERTQSELALRIILGAPLIATKSYGAPEVEETFARAREICQRIGEVPQLFPVLLGLCVFHLVRGELQMAWELGEQLQRLSQSVHNPVFSLLTHYAQGPILFWLGEFAPARAHLEQAITLYNAQPSNSPSFPAGQDPGVACLSYAALVSWFLSYPDQALKRSAEALALAQKLSHPQSLAVALNFSALVRRNRRERQETQKLTKALVTLADEQGFPYWSAVGKTSLGWVLATQGQVEDGILQLQISQAAYRTVGIKVGWPYSFAILAEAYGKARQVEEGLSVLAEAFTLARSTGECCYEAELCRLKGHLTLQSKVQGSKSKVSNPQFEEAEDCFQQALTIARRQQAKSLELRAAVSLGQLWKQQGKKKQAYTMLADVYDWFTEGFDTPDLQDARALLTTLA
ncbi:MAG: hypothetical protein ACRERD_29250, partial [Candidatus Binatia bacterium]